jgi:hypothetical protein
MLRLTLPALLVSVQQFWYPTVKGRFGIGTKNMNTAFGIQTFGCSTKMTRLIGQSP